MFFGFSFVPTLFQTQEFVETKKAVLDAISDENVLMNH